MLIDKEFMAAAEYNFTIEQGTTFTKSFVWKNNSGVAVDLTGYTARMQVRLSVTSEDVLLTASTTNGKLALTPLEGKITLSLSAQDTAGFDWKRGKYDLELEDADGRVTRLLFGLITVSLEVTRD